MVRTVLVLAVLGGVTFAVVSWATGGQETATNPIRKDRPAEGQGSESRQQGPKEKTFSAKIERPHGQARAVAVTEATGLLEPLTIPDSRVNIIYRQEVSGARQGQILVLGTEIDPKTLAPLQKKKLIAEEKLVTIKMAHLAVEATPEEIARRIPVFRIRGDARVWRYWQEEDAVHPNRLNVVLEQKTFLRLQKGMRVRKGQLVGLVNPALTVEEMQIKIAKLNASAAEVRSSKKTRDEAYSQYQRIVRIGQTQGAAAQEEINSKKLTWERYIEEEKAKAQGVNVARKELRQAFVTLKLHELRAAISGVVKAISKNEGEAVKEGDVILELQNPDLLQVEGYVPVQEAKKLRLGMPVVVEPVQPEAPAGVLRGHREAVNAVAVSKGARPLIVSASEDRTAAIWKVVPEKDGHTGKVRWTGKVIFHLEHPAAVRSVACTPPTAKNNLCLTGTAAGVGRLWNLDTLAKDGKAIELAEAHRGPINTVAFSPDGSVCATGSEDRSICLWDTANGKLLHRLNGAHKGSVTSLFFTPKKQLVSSGRDGNIVVWGLKDNEAPTRVREIDQLGGLVHVVGVSADGTQVLFDQGRQLRVLSLNDKSTKGVITNTSATVNFTTFALFSPDGNAVLTAGSSDNRLQLWRNPVTCKRARATEMRQYMWPEARTTCAAFAPQAPFVVTGTHNHQVVLWSLPAREEYKEAPANAIITHIDQFLESSSRQVRIIAEVQNKTSGLKPGSTATMVVYPK